MQVESHPTGNFRWPFVGCLVLDNLSSSSMEGPSRRNQSRPHHMHLQNIVGLVYQLAIAADEIHQSHQTWAFEDFSRTWTQQLSQLWLGKRYCQLAMQAVWETIRPELMGRGRPWEQFLNGTSRNVGSPWLSSFLLSHLFWRSLKFLPFFYCFQLFSCSSQWFGNVSTFSPVLFSLVVCPLFQVPGLISNLFHLSSIWSQRPFVISTFLGRFTTPKKRYHCCKGRNNMANEKTLRSSKKARLAVGKLVGGQ